MLEQFAKGIRAFLPETQMLFHVPKHGFDQLKRRVYSFQIAEENYYRPRIGFRPHFEHYRSFTDAPFGAQDDALPVQAA
jgi:hypothetical protein